MSMETNKIFAAFLVAGIISMLCWFLSHELYHPEPLEKNAYVIAAAGGEEAAPVAAAPTGPEPIDDLMKTADAEKGKQIAKICASCHTLGKGEPARIGPNLFGIVGNHHAHMAGFSYSSAMESLSKETWDVDHLNHFLWNPRKTIDGTKMTFAGLKKAQDRADVIKYLETLK
ncbi:MAG: c-type cytochrome [Alphaproteobacteria bacterium]|nr:c-type cytochrome [Alphaproteobacteria bacterium]